MTAEVKEGPLGFEFPEDQNSWNGLHWFVYMIHTSGPVDVDTALRIGSTLLKNPAFVISAMQEGGIIETQVTEEQAKQIVEEYQRAPRDFLELSSKYPHA